MLFIRIYFFVFDVMDDDYVIFENEVDEFMEEVEDIEVDNDVEDDNENDDDE